MIGRRYAFAVLIAAVATPAISAEYLTSIESDVFQTKGSTREIALRGKTCMAQLLSAGTTNSDLFINSDLDSGVIVARSAMTYGHFPEWEIRSRFTFEARDGRFRITQTDLERFNEMAGGWGPIGKWTGSQSSGAENAFKTSALAVALCVTQPKNDNW